MDFLRRLFGDTLDPEPETQRRPAPRPDRPARPERSEDERALERYRYLLRTAPPETLEQAHAEAFAQLTPEQRRMVLEELTQDMPAQEREAAAGAADDPRALARVATRAEMRQPGTLERRFSQMPAGAGIGFGGMLTSSFLGTIAGVMVGSAIANAFFNDAGGMDGGDAGAGEMGATELGDTGEAGFDTGDAGDFGADFGDFGGGGEF